MSMNIECFVVECEESLERIPKRVSDWSIGSKY